MIRPVWVMFGRMPVRGQAEVTCKQAIRCSGRQTPYTYRAREEAERNLDIAYPSQRHEDRLDNTRNWYVEDVSQELVLMLDDPQISRKTHDILMNFLHDAPLSEDAFQDYHDEFLGRVYPHLFGPA